MLDAKARWIVPAAEDAAAVRLAEALQLHPLVARLLSVRGIDSVEAAERFLNGGAEQFHDPFMMKGMSEAVDRIRLALKRKEKIVVYGDYDADGVTSTALMQELLESLGADCSAYIPHRVLEGYGLNKEALDQAKASGVSLVVTVDTGISSREEAAYAAGLGIDIVVTDHHEPPEGLPDAAALVNPKQPGCPYPCKDLAGVGVAFKLAHALLGEMPARWLELAAIGTIADLMPLVDENRIIVRLGLERMRTSSHPGLSALLHVAGIERSAINETHIGFAVAPRINAAGRMDHANLALRLLTSGSKEEAEQLALRLDGLNRERQQIVEDITNEALSHMKDAAAVLSDKRVIVAAGEGWNVGVVGIVASRLLEKYYRPVVVLAVDPETGTVKGSARSIDGFDIHRALTACEDLLDHYGGHQAAAGLTLRRENVDKLGERLDKLAREWLQEEQLAPILQADAACSLSDTPLSCIEELSQLAPFGNGNPVPRFIFPGLSVSGKRTMGRANQHLRLMLAAAEETACSMEAVGFGYGPAAAQIAPASRIDVLGELSINEWNGTRRPQIVIQDLRISVPQVFDWRGTKATREKQAPEWMNGWGLLLFSGGSTEGPPADHWLAGGSLWRASGLEPPVPLNGAARDTDLADLQDVVLYGMPPYKEWLDGALSRMKGVKRLYAVFADSHTGPGEAVPDREAFKRVYALLTKEGVLNTADERVWPALSRRFGLSRDAVLLILQVFRELGFIRQEGDMFCPVPNPGKRELSESELYRRAENRGRMEQLYIYSTASELTELLLASLQQEEGT